MRASAVPAHRGKRVLCVDDEPLVLEGLRLQLRHYGEVLTALSGAEGLAILRQDQDIAVIIADMRMPGMDGAEFLRLARELAPDTTRILLTGQADIEPAMRAINDGQVFRFLLKPCPPAVLLNAVAAATSKHRLARARRLLSRQLAQAANNIEDSEAALRTIFKTACDLFECRYAAMMRQPVAGYSAALLLTHGLPPELFDSESGDPPAALAAALRTDSATCHLAAGTGLGGLEGLPPGHPEVTEVLGTALSGAAQRHGWMYFADAARRAPFAPDDEQAAAALGAACALICEAAERRQHTQEHTRQMLARDGQLEYLSYHDALTGLATRQLFLNRTDELLHAARIQNSRLCVMSLDLKNFRYLNDTLGKGVCDEILKNLGERLGQLADDRARVARVGGDRFAVVIVGAQAAADPAELLSSAICNPLRAPLLAAGQSLQLTGTVGISMFPDDGDDADGLLCNAEAAMKSTNASSSGSHARAYTRELGTAISQRMKLEARLRQASERHEFRLHYQPKIELRSGSVCGAEALLRWQSPDLGMVPPLQFIQVLEETGLIMEVGSWVLRQAVADRKLWLSEGLTPPPIAVNVSPLQLRAADFVDSVLAAIGGQAGDRDGISLEITESVLMSGADDIIAKLHCLRDRGVAIAIDDFGTGYSSLAYLTRLPVSAVKIDRSFVIRIGDSADTLAIVSAVISLARALNLKVIAEGVDTAEQLKFLRLLRCDEFQGFLFSQGLPAAEFSALLRQGRRLPFETAACVD